MKPPTNLNVSTSDRAREYRRALWTLPIQRNLDVGLLIDDLEEKYHLPVSILIDNYDTPIISSINYNKHQKVVKVLSTFLTTFYDKIRAYAEEDKLRLVFVVGFYKVNILGNKKSRYRDLTFDGKFSSMFGFTLEEVQQYLKPYVDNLAKKEKKQSEYIQKKMNDWYGG